MPANIEAKALMLDRAADPAGLTAAYLLTKAAVSPAGPAPTIATSTALVDAGILVVPCECATGMPGEG